MVADNNNNNILISDCALGCCCVIYLSILCQGFVLKTRISLFATATCIFNGSFNYGRPSEVHTKQTFCPQCGYEWYVQVCMHRCALLILESFGGRCTADAYTYTYVHVMYMHSYAHARVEHFRCQAHVSHFQVNFVHLISNSNELADTSQVHHPASTATSLYDYTELYLLQSVKWIEM